METQIETPVETVQTGAIVVISGEYAPVDHTTDEPTFLSWGEYVPGTDGIDTEWQLLQAYDFAS